MLEQNETMSFAQALPDPMSIVSMLNTIVAKEEDEPIPIAQPIIKACALKSRMEATLAYLRPKTLPLKKRKTVTKALSRLDPRPEAEHCLPPTLAV